GSNKEYVIRFHYTEKEKPRDSEAFLFLESQHLDCRKCSLFSFIAILSTSTIKGLLFIQRSEYAKDYRLTGFQANFSKAISNSLADVVKVGSFSLNDTT